MRWTLGDIARLTGGELVRGDPARVVTRVGTDSRSIEPGALFFALRGPNFDGHDFVLAALDSGACGAVVSRDVPADRGCLVRVADTLRALGDLARAVRRSAPFEKVFALTGSNGKTTTKEMLASICETVRPGEVLKTEGNWNNLVGVPLTLLRYEGQRIGVFELAMNRRGEIARLTEIVAPDHAALLNVGPAHLEALGSLEGVADAKAEMLENLPGHAVAVLNADDPWVRRVSGRFPGRKVWFGREEPLRIENFTAHGFEGISFDLCAGVRRARVRLRVVGEHNARNALAAAALALSAEIPLEAVVEGLESFRPVAMRMEVLRLRNGVTVVHDAYNANPASVEAALRTLRSLAGRPLAVLGEMRELGSGAEEEHRRVGEWVARYGVEEVVVVGRAAEAIAVGALSQGMRADAVARCETPEEAARLVRERWRPGDVVLVKGSRLARLERTVELLRKAS
ncbi:MAG: UDP-N-acetylmuramoyl-tripeptide--D-alanyl-D-alanine ligase [Candidatus Binatia bacterium]|nr:MAG: UDP-N-acetylmuramoyl-tripeptide--D-alanyl-D-alanine ligase [Candidatus Binatia bacterium]